MLADNRFISVASPALHVVRLEGGGSVRPLRRIQHPSEKIQGGYFLCKHPEREGLRGGDKISRRKVDLLLCPGEKIPW